MKVFIMIKLIADFNQKQIQKKKKNSKKKII